MGINNLSAEEKIRLLNQIEREEKELQSLFDETKQADPYWWYAPSDGYISSKGKEFIEKWIKPEDIPQKFYGIDQCFKSNARIVGTFGGNQGKAGTTISFKFR